MNLRRLAVLSLTTLSLGLVAGCGHSEDEWQAKLRELSASNKALDDERAAQRFEFRLRRDSLHLRQRHARGALEKPRHVK